MKKNDVEQLKITSINSIKIMNPKLVIEMYELV